MIQNCANMIPIGEEYRLVLGNGLGWQLTSTAGVKLEVAELARIMGLKSNDSHGYPRLIFIRTRNGNVRYEETICGLGKMPAEDLRGLGWKATELSSLRIWSHNKTTDLICEIRDEKGSYREKVVSMMSSLYPIYHQAQNAGGFPLHAALLKKNGMGVILVAPGGTGKSTCCRRLRSPWQPLCDDETLVILDDQKRYLAHPFPTWSDCLTRRSRPIWDVQTHLPLSSIFFLEQANSDKVTAVGQGEAAVYLHQSAMQVYHRYWNSLDDQDIRTRKKKLFENACALAKEVPTFKLRMSLKGRFWEEMERVL